MCLTKASSQLPHLEEFKLEKLEYDDFQDEEEDPYAFEEEDEGRTCLQKYASGVDPVTDA